MRPRSGADTIDGAGREERMIVLACARGMTSRAMPVFAAQPQRP